MKMKMNSGGASKTEQLLHEFKGACFLVAKICMWGVLHSSETRSKTSYTCMQQGKCQREPKRKRQEGVI